MEINTTFSLDDIFFVAKKDNRHNKWRYYRTTVKRLEITNFGIDYILFSENHYNDGPTFSETFDHKIDMEWPSHWVFQTADEARIFCEKNNSK